MDRVAWHSMDLLPDEGELVAVRGLRWEFDAARASVCRCEMRRLKIVKNKDYPDSTRGARESCSRSTVSGDGVDQDSGMSCLPRS